MASGSPHGAVRNLLSEISHSHAMTLRDTAARRRHHRHRRAGIILLNCRNSETCNKKEKTPLLDHLEYLLVQNPLGDQHKDRT